MESGLTVLWSLKRNLLWNNLIIKHCCIILSTLLNLYRINWILTLTVVSLVFLCTWSLNWTGFSVQCEWMWKRQVNELGITWKHTAPSAGKRLPMQLLSGSELWRKLQNNLFTLSAVCTVRNLVQVCFQQRMCTVGKEQGPARDVALQQCM